MTGCGQSAKNCLEATRILSRVSTSDDFVFPLDKISDAIMDLSELAATYPFRVFTLAHAGDGNLHLISLKGSSAMKLGRKPFHPSMKRPMPMSMPMTAFFPVNMELGQRSRTARAFDGPWQMFMMTAIKKALDPLDVLNPGKVIARY